MKNALCIFAHPDDEAFGPSGTIAKWTKTHNVSIICVTDGGGGLNHSKKSGTVSAIRKSELLNSATILGVKKTYFLGLNDGEICNNQYHKIAGAITKIVDKVKPEIMMTYEPRGISGHIDHIATSMISTYVFEKSSYIKKLYYYCLDQVQRALILSYYIYVPPGYSNKEINHREDVSSVWNTKVAAIKAHESQIKDGGNTLKMLLAASLIKGFRKEECFLVKKK